MSFARPLLFCAVVASAAAAMAHGSRLAASPAAEAANQTTALAALIAAAALFGLAVRRFTDGNAVVSATAAALYAAHPAFLGFGRAIGRAAPGTAAPAILFFGVALAFAGAALRRSPFASAPPLRRDRRRLAEIALYSTAALCDPRLVAAPLIGAVTDVWFHPDAPTAWRRSTLRTALLSTSAAAITGLASLALTDRLSTGASGVFGLQAAAGGALGFDLSRPLAASRTAPWIACFCLLLPAGILSRASTRPRAVLLAVGVAGLWAFVGAWPSAFAAKEAATLGAAGVALALPLLMWRVAAALTAVGEFADLTPIPSVPALRDVLASVDLERGPVVRPSGVPDSAAIEASVRSAVDAAFAAARAATADRDRRWASLLAPDRRQPTEDDRTARRRFVRDELLPKLRGARTALVVGDPPADLVLALAERIAVDLRPSTALDAADARAFELSTRIRVLAVSTGEESRPPVRYDAVLSFRGHELGEAAAVVRHLRALRSEARRGAAIGLITMSAVDLPGLPAWYDLPEGSS